MTVLGSAELAEGSRDSADTEVRRPRLYAAGIPPPPPLDGPVDPEGPKGPPDLEGW